MTITQWRDGVLMGVRHDGVVTRDGRVELEARGDTTTITWRETLRLPWWMLGPVGAFAAHPVLARVWRANLRRLGALVEGPAASA